MRDPKLDAAIERHVRRSRERVALIPFHQRTIVSMDEAIRHNKRSTKAMEVETKVKAYDEDGSEDDFVVVASSPTSNKRIVIKIGFKEVHVSASEMLKAIQNAMNT